MESDYGSWETSWEKRDKWLSSVKDKVLDLIKSGYMRRRDINGLLGRDSDTQKAIDSALKDLLRDGIIERNEGKAPRRLGVMYRIKTKEECFRSWLENSAIEAALSNIEQKYPAVKIEAYETGRKIELMQIIVPKEMRGSGVGTEIIRMLQDYARSVSKPIVIRPAAERGRKGDLDKFYKGLGFVHNAGRNKDFTLSSPLAGTMYWRASDDVMEATTPKVIMYHGTAFRNLRSIMSHGLLPNPKGRAWKSDSDSGFNNASRASLDGIYLTGNLMTALSAASNGSNRQHMEEGDLLIAVEMQPKTAFADEDDLNFLSVVSDHSYVVASLYDSWKKGIHPEFVEEHMNKYKERALARIGIYMEIHPNLKARLWSMLSEVFFAALERQAAYVADTIKRNFKDLQAPDKGSSEEGYMRAREKVTRTMKSFANPFKHSRDPFSLTGRVEEPIGFRGTNRIVCIMHVPFDYKEKPKLIYGEAPEDLIRQWKQSKGEWKGVEK